MEERREAEGQLRHCARWWPAGSEFCGVCGRPLRPEAQSSTSRPKRPRRLRGLWRATALVLIGWALVVLVVTVAANPAESLATAWRPAPLSMLVVSLATLILLVRAGLALGRLGRRSVWRMVSLTLALVVLLGVLATAAIASPQLHAGIVQPLRQSALTMFDTNAWRTSFNGFPRPGPRGIIPPVLMQPVPVIRPGVPVTVFALPGPRPSTLQPFAVATQTHLLPLRNVSPSVVRDLPTASVPVQRVIMFPGPQPRAVPAADSSRIPALEYRYAASACGGCPTSIQVEVNPELVRKLALTGAGILLPVATVSGSSAIELSATLADWGIVVSELLRGLGESPRAGAAPVAGKGAAELVRSLAKPMLHGRGLEPGFQWIPQLLRGWLGAAAGQVVTEGVRGGPEPAVTWSWKLTDRSQGSVTSSQGLVAWQSRRQTTYFGLSPAAGWSETWNLQVVERSTPTAGPSPGGQAGRGPTPPPLPPRLPPPPAPRPPPPPPPIDR
jgi:hypothetical protein